MVNPATFPVQRRGGSGPIAEEPSGGAEFSPIQNIRFLDPAYVGDVSNGSIGNPFTLFPEFTDEIFTDVDGDWLLNLPNGTVTGVSVPNFDDAPNVVFQGLGINASALASLTLTGQEEPANIEFRDLAIETVAFGASSDGTYSFENVALSESSVVGGTLSVRITLINCVLSGNNFLDTFGTTLNMIGGSISGELRFAGGVLTNVQFADGSTIRPGGATSLIGCKFGTGVTINNTFAPTVTFDPYSYATFLAGGGTFAGTKVFEPVIPVFAQVTNNDEDSIPGGGQSNIDFGTVTPPAQPLSAVVGNFNSDPGNGNFKLQDVHVDNSGHIIALIVNNFNDTLQLAELTLNILYQVKLVGA